MGNAIITRYAQVTVFSFVQQLHFCEEEQGDLQWREVNNSAHSSPFSLSIVRNMVNIPSLEGCVYRTEVGTDFCSSAVIRSLFNF